MQQNEGKLLNDDNYDQQDYHIHDFIGDNDSGIMIAMWVNITWWTLTMKMMSHQCCLS